MPAPIRITKPVGPDENPPSMNLRFRGKNQIPFFDFRKIALAQFNTDATSLAILLVLDFVKEQKEFPHSTRSRRLAQQAMALGGDKTSAGSADKKGASPRRQK